MDETRKSLLIRVRDPHDSQAWREFYSIYGPMIYRYARLRGLSASDAEEIRDQCMAVVVEKIGGFTYDRSRGRFKSWLHRIANHKIITTFRKRRVKQADSFELKAVVSEEPGPDELWDQEWRNKHLRYCVQQIKQEVPRHHYLAFRMLTFEGRSVPEVCEELEMNSNQVYKAKSRILERIRQKVGELGIEELE